MIKSVSFPSFEVPAVLKQKAIYMKSKEFLNDAHNKKMFELSEQLLELRDGIAKEIKLKNETAKDEIVQGINGFSRIKKYLDKNYKMNFSENQTFFSPTENQYLILKIFHIRNMSRKAESDIKKTNLKSYEL